LRCYVNAAHARVCREISTSYLFVGTREFEMLRANDGAAVVSTPVIGPQDLIREVQARTEPSRSYRG